MTSPVRHETTNLSENIVDEEADEMITKAFAHGDDQIGYKESVTTMTTELDAASMETAAMNRHVDT